MRDAQQRALVDWLAAELGWPASTARVERIGTGHSRAMYVVTPDGATAVVVRVEQGGVFGTSGAEECRVMRGLRAVGYPVAPILAQEPSGVVIGRPFFVMGHIASGAARRDERAMDVAAAGEFVAVLHRLHGLDGAAFGFDVQPVEPSHATSLQVERWRGVYRAACAEPIPLLEEAAAWLVHHAPPLDRLAVVHGDAGPGNVIHDGATIAAVTDFEFCHLGDPAEDWSFCASMRGASTMSRDAWLQLFRQRAGVEMSASQWRYWDAFNLFKGACANRTCLDLFERGVTTTPNMAIIGTTLHQVFLRRLATLVHD